MTVALIALGEEGRAWWPTQPAAASLFAAEFGLDLTAGRALVSDVGVHEAVSGPGQR